MATALATSLKDLNHSMIPLTRLIQFFAKYPPSQYSAIATEQFIPTFKQKVSTGAKPLSSTAVPRTTSTTHVQANPPVETNASQSLSTTSTTGESSTKSPPNPFLPYKNPETGRWRGARIGLRQQADLFKFARELGVEELLPASIKSSVYKQQRALERGLAVKGTGEGQRVKGHKWERSMAATLEKRKKAMENMPELIREWEQRGHGRGWKKYPR